MTNFNNQFSLQTNSTQHNPTRWRGGHLRVAFYLGFKASPCEPFNVKNEFDLHENRHSDKTHFHMNGFVRNNTLEKITRF